MRFQFLSERFKLRGGGNENDLRPQSDYSLNARFQSVTNCFDLLSFRGISAIAGSANQPVPSPDRINNLGQAWRQRDESRDRVRDRNSSAGLISWLMDADLTVSFFVIRLRTGGEQKSKRQDQSEDASRASECLKL